MQIRGLVRNCHVMAADVALAPPRRSLCADLLGVVYCRVLRGRSEVLVVVGRDSTSLLHVAVWSMRAMLDNLSSVIVIEHAILPLSSIGEPPLFHGHTEQGAERLATSRFSLIARGAARPHVVMPRAPSGGRGGGAGGTSLAHSQR